MLEYSKMIDVAIKSLPEPFTSTEIITEIKHVFSDFNDNDVQKIKDEISQCIVNSKSRPAFTGYSMPLLVSVKRGYYRRFDLVADRELYENSQQYLFEQLRKKAANQTIRGMEPDDFATSMLGSLKSGDTEKIYNALKQLKSVAWMESLWPYYQPIVLELLDLMHGDDDQFDLVWDVLRYILRKGEIHVVQNLSEILERINTYSKPDSLTRIQCLHEIAMINLSLVLKQLSFIVNQFESSKDITERRIASWIIGEIAEKDSTLVESTIPKITEYVRYSEKTDSIDSENLANPDEMISVVFGAEEGEEQEDQESATPAAMLRYSCIGTLCKFAKVRPELLTDIIPLLRDISQNAEGKHTRAKASEALALLHS